MADIERKGNVPSLEAANGAGAGAAATPAPIAAATDANAVGRRRSDRVMLSLAIEVTATDHKGARFTEASRTEMVSRHGASIVLGRGVSLEQGMTVRRPTLDLEIKATILGQLGIRTEGPVYGVAFVSEAPDFWGISFPPPAAEGDVAPRVLLQCVGCIGRRIFTLNEMEFRVFEANQRLSHPCVECSKATTWMRVPTATAADGREISKGPQDRLHQRTKVKMMACIQYPGRKDDVVQLMDVSRGGVSFRSDRNYAQDCWINVAAPYTPGTANIFVAGRIARKQPTEDPLCFEYGVQYVKG